MTSVYAASLPGYQTLNYYHVFTGPLDPKASCTTAPLTPLLIYLKHE